MANLTKEILNKFIEDSARRCRLSVASYLENRASKSYVVLDGTRPITFTEGGTDLCVFDSRDLAFEEASEYAKGKVVREYDYYVSRGLFKVA